MNKSLYTVEFEELIVYDWEKKKDSIFECRREAQIARHKLFQYYKQYFPQYKYRFKDFKIVEYIQKNKEAV